MNTNEKSVIENMTPAGKATKPAATKATKPAATMAAKLAAAATKATKPAATKAAKPAAATKATKPAAATKAAKPAATRGNNGARNAEIDSSTLRCGSKKPMAGARSEIICKLIEAAPGKKMKGAALVEAATTKLKEPESAVRQLLRSLYDKDIIAAA